jgi:hypothetical protein
MPNKGKQRREEFDPNSHGHSENASGAGSGAMNEQENFNKPNQSLEDEGLNEDVRKDND